MSYQPARRGALLAAAFVLTAWTHGAWGFPATVTDIVHLRAGPDVFYPSVALLGRGSTVEVFGCEQGFGWCDVQIGAQRGWVSSDFLLAQGPSGPVVVAGNGVTLGLAVTPFVFNAYWGSHYRGMPWYGNPRYFGHWNRFPHGRPPPPPHFRPRPPVRPPPVMRPPPRPMPTPRPPPPGSTRPPGGAPPTGRPPSGTRPPSSGRPPPASTRPATSPDTSQPR